MRIGNYEIGVLGLISLVLIIPGTFLTFYGLIRDLFMCFFGALLLVIALMVYYLDLQNRRNQQPEIKLGEIESPTP
jgi:hypothetical protein